MTSLVGYSRPCGAYTSGIQTLYLVSAADLTSMTLGTGVQTYSTITMVTSKVFKTYAFEVDQAELRFEATMENGTFSEKAIIEIFMPELSSTLRNAIQEFADESACGMVAIVKLNNQNTTTAEAFVIGYNQITGKTRPLRLESANGTSGKTLSDQQGETVVFSCSVPEKSRLLTDGTSIPTS